MASERKTKVVKSRSNKIHPSKVEIKRFLDSAVVDPNKRDDFITRQLVIHGDPAYFETRVVEYMQEASRLRSRILANRGRKPTILLEEYALVMRKAATAIAISVGKLDYSQAMKYDEPPTTQGKDRAGGNNSI